jgi:hypothetical protein
MTKRKRKRRNPASITTRYQNQAAENESEFLTDGIPNFVEVNDLTHTKRVFTNHEEERASYDANRRCRNMQAAVVERTLKDLGAVKQKSGGAYELRQVRFMKWVKPHDREESLFRLLQEPSAFDQRHNPYNITRILKDQHISKSALIERIGLGPKDLRAACRKLKINYLILQERIGLSSGSLDSEPTTKAA